MKRRRQVKAPQSIDQTTTMTLAASCTEVTRDRCIWGPLVLCRKPPLNNNHQRIIHSFHIQTALNTEFLMQPPAIFTQKRCEKCCITSKSAPSNRIVIYVVQVYREFTVLKLSLEAGEMKAKTRLETTSHQRNAQKKPGSSIVTHRYSFSASKCCFCALPAHTAVS